MDTVEIRLARQRHSSREPYQGQVVNVWLTTMSTGWLNMDAELRKEKGSDCYIRQVNNSDGYSVRSFKPHVQNMWVAFPKPVYK